MILDKSGNLLFRYKWGEPRYINFALGFEVTPGSVGAAGRNIACHDWIGTPIVTRSQIASMTGFTLLSSTADGNGGYSIGQVGRIQKCL